MLQTNFNHRFQNVGEGRHLHARPKCTRTKYLTQAYVSRSVACLQIRCTIKLWMFILTKLVTSNSRAMRMTINLTDIACDQTEVQFAREMNRAL